ncbi:MAG TPA: hypothetical protein PKZ97_05065 [Azospirillaceae bacterium]|nr:hypothetical protein [Azospirillaceae bacterium]HRQ80469.1 hypothetical protein [Azospirillaceae bacterium]
MIAGNMMAAQFYVKLRGGRKGGVQFQIIGLSLSGLTLWRL